MGFLWKFSWSIELVWFWIPELIACMFLNYDLQHLEQSLRWLHRLFDLFLDKFMYMICQQLNHLEPKHLELDKYKLSRISWFALLLEEMDIWFRISHQAKVKNERERERERPKLPKKKFLFFNFLQCI